MTPEAPYDRCVAIMKTYGERCQYDAVTTHGPEDLPLCAHHHNRLEEWMTHEAMWSRWDVEGNRAELQRLRDAIEHFDPRLVTRPVPPRPVVLDELCNECQAEIAACDRCAMQFEPLVTCGRASCRTRLRLETSDAVLDAHERDEHDDEPDRTCFRCHFACDECRADRRYANEKAARLREARAAALREFDLLDSAVITAVQQAVNRTLSALGVEPRGRRVGALLVGHGTQLMREADDASNTGYVMHVSDRERIAARQMTPHEVQELSKEPSIPRRRS